MPHFYLIGLGSNKRHVKFGAPERIVAAALHALNAGPVKVDTSSNTIRSLPVGPSLHRFANAAALVQTDLSPAALLKHLKQIEQSFGNRRGQRWSARVLDLDIILWSGGSFANDTLTIPHIAFRDRDFVLKPACEIAPDWRDPITGKTLRQLYAGRRKSQPTISGI